MTHEVTEILKAEHSAIKAVLMRLRIDLADQHARNRLPDFDGLRMMLFYVDEFAEKHHHRRESRLLFPTLRARAPDLQHTLDRLESSHQRNKENLLEVEHSMLAFEMVGRARRLGFDTAIARFIDGYFAHMDVEERHVLPTAEAALAAEDWEEIDATFRRDGEPARCADTSGDYQDLLWRFCSGAAGVRLASGFTPPHAGRW